jgi:hypothetical protein
VNDFFKGLIQKTTFGQLGPNRDTSFLPVQEVGAMVCRRRFILPAFEIVIAIPPLKSIAGGRHLWSFSRILRLAVHFI